MSRGLSAASDSKVNISGGVINNYFNVYSRSEVDISGGIIDAAFTIHNNSDVNISGGEIRFLLAVPGSEVNISGGTVAVLKVDSGSTVNLFGTRFFLDGVLLDELTPGEAFTINDRNVILSGIMEDGLEFSHFLGNFYATPDTWLSDDSTITITLVPEPASLSIAILGLITLAGAFRRHRLR